ncbi:hypothetical protein PGTUg99_021757 [Puccinia graminis f. sp. tritici]|uniref:Uncharacterized protein n=1 Tax=Puccinia graminis f. sp. tritici TaxID=56615 RepID=A0A5B0RZK6_PUCGR|nr:hypothetical protein PGTUg99_021757 [Puccinia graminis f. sp. tritici]
MQYSACNHLRLPGGGAVRSERGARDQTGRVHTSKYRSSAGMTGRPGDAVPSAPSRFRSPEAFVPPDFRPARARERADRQTFS